MDKKEIFISSGAKRQGSKYIDNEKFLEALIAYKKLFKEHKKAKLEAPQIPDYIGECFLLIAQNMSTAPRFADYVFRDDMIADAYENCILKILKFDARKSKHPVTYFSVMSFYAFIRRIKKEKAVLYAKYKMVQDNILFNEECFIRQYGSDTANANMEEYIEKYEAAMEKKKLESKNKAKEVKKKGNLYLRKKK